jgi:hypothetical protein
MFRSSSSNLYGVVGPTTSTVCEQLPWKGMYWLSMIEERMLKVKQESLMAAASAERESPLPSHISYPKWSLPLCELRYNVLCRLHAMHLANGLDPLHVKSEVSCFKLKGEDYHCCKPSVPVTACIAGHEVSCTYAIFGVFDGHGGKRAAEFSSKQVRLSCVQNSCS